MALFRLKVVDMARKIESIDVDYVVNQYSAGRSILDISGEFSVSRNVIERRLIQAGVQLRGQSEASIVRMSKLTKDQRLALAANAHNSIRGTKRSFETLVKCAIAKQASQSSVSEHEQRIMHALRGQGIDPIPQLAIGPYNCDLACYPVAVEVFGGQWHFSGRHLARAEKRIRYLGNAGWHVLMLVVDEGVAHYRFGADTADHIATYVQQARSNPSGAREYRVIDCRGHTLAGGRCDDDHISVIPAFANRRNVDSGRYERVAR
jgi:hypothetical protein